MGEPVRIVDLAKKMIHLSGLEIKDESHPDGDIELEYTGLRPGEKLFEELLIGDNVKDTDNPIIMLAEEESLSWNELNPVLEKLNNAITDCNQKSLRSLLVQIVPGFKPQCDISDILYKDK
jgi:FlaA1/EpsC-like NDP-sugar epimerase